MVLVLGKVLILALQGEPVPAGSPAMGTAHSHVVDSHVLGDGLHDSPARSKGFFKTLVKRAFHLSPHALCPRHHATLSLPALELQQRLQSCMLSCSTDDASTRDKFVVLGCRHATSLRANRAKYLLSLTLRSLTALHLARLSASGSRAAVVTPQCWPETTAAAEVLA